VLIVDTWALPPKFRSNNREGRVPPRPWAPEEGQGADGEALGEAFPPPPGGAGVVMVVVLDGTVDVPVPNQFHCVKPRKREDDQQDEQ
jgi:hypothetical protein